jgi:uncharacterized membrane protein
MRRTVSVISGGLWAVAALLSVAVALFSLRYLAWTGPLPETVIENPFAMPWLPIHAAAAATALLVGAFQLLPRVRARLPRLHRWNGRLYVLACAIGGVTGLVLALGSTAGPVATAGFGTLGIAWLFATLLAWRRAVQRRFAEHRAWMIRSWALTFAAVTLRLYLPMIPFFDVSFMDGYRAISFLCWTANLAAAELYLLARPRPAT